MPHHPFDFHEVFTLQKLWQWLLSCAKAFTYVVYFRIAAPVIAIILTKKKKKIQRQTWGLSFNILFYLCLLWSFSPA